MGKGFKTKKSILKRFKVTGKGKLKIKKTAGHSHLQGSKSPKRKRQLKRQPLLGPTMARKMKRMIQI